MQSVPKPSYGNPIRRLGIRTPIPDASVSAPGNTSQKSPSGASSSARLKNANPGATTLQAHMKDISPSRFEFGHPAVPRFIVASQQSIGHALGAQPVKVESISPFEIGVDALLMLCFCLTYISKRLNLSP
jgi:hypothetical protein